MQHLIDPYCFLLCVGVVSNRVWVLRAQIKQHPQFSNALQQKITEIEEDMPLICDRNRYESLLLQFEKVLDECEAELATHGET